MIHLLVSPLLVHPLRTVPIPTPQELFEWPNIFGGGFNKTALMYVVSALIAFFFWWSGARKQQLVPRGMQNIVEMLYNFIRNNIVVDVMGESQAALKYVPFLSAMFTFILFCNIFEVIPPILFPATSRMAIPFFLAIMVWFIFIIQGIASQGAGHYLKGVLFPPGVPVVMYILLTPIELISTFLLRPITLAVRLFANMFAGHTIISLFLVFSWANFELSPRIVVWIPSFALLIALMGFEIFVAFIQAFIFTILTAVYVGEGLHGH